MRLLSLACLLGSLTLLTGLRDAEPVVPDERDQTAALKDADPAVRARAAEELARQGPSARAALPQLRDALKDESPLVRVRAAAALWRIDRQLQDGLPILLAARADPDESTRTAAAEVLRGLGPGVRAVIPWALQLVKNGEWQAEFKIAVALGPSGLEAVPALLEALAQDDPAAARPDDAAPAGPASERKEAHLHLCKAAGVTLARLGPPALPMLTALLKDRHASARLAATDAFWRLGSAATEAWPALAEVLRDPEPEVRIRAAHALRRIGLRTPAVAPVLVKALEDREPVVRGVAVLSLLEVRPVTPAAAPALRQTLKDAVPIIRIRAAEALLHGGAEVEEAVRLLIAEIQSGDEERRRLGANALMVLGARGRVALAALRELTKDKNGAVRQTAVRVLGGVSPSDPPGVTALLAAALKDEEVTVRRQAVLAFQQGAAERAALVTALGGALRDADPEVSIRSAEALWKLGEYRESLPILLRAFAREGPAHPDDRPPDRPTFPTRETLADRILGSPSRSAVPALAEVLRTDFGTKREIVLRVLERMGRDAEDAAPALVEILTGNHGRARVEAAKVLGEIGTATPETVRALVETLRGKDRSLARAACATLRRIGPEARASVPAVLGVLQHADSSLLREALQLLASLGVPAKRVLPLVEVRLKEKDEATVTAVVSQLRRFGEPAVPLLLDALGHPAPRVRESALHGLARVRPLPPAAASRIAHLMAENEESVRRAAVSALVSGGPEAERLLVQACEHPEPRVRQTALESLRWHAEHEAGALAMIRRALTDPDLGVRCQAGSVLYGVTNEPEPAGQALLEALKSADAKVRQRAADSIYRIKDRPKSWVPALTAALQDADPAVRQHVAIALAAMEGPESEAVEILAELLRSRNPRTITDTLSFLRQLGPAAKPLLPALVELLEHPEARTYAGQASHALGTLGTSAIEPLLRLVTADDHRVRGHAFNAFTWMGPAAVPTLRWLGTSNENDMRIKVVWALGRLRPRTPEITAALADALLNESVEEIRETAVAALWMADRRWPEAGIRRGRSVVSVPAVGAGDRLDAPVLSALLDRVRKLPRAETVEELEALGRGGPDAGLAVPVLTELLASPFGHVRVLAAETLARTEVEPSASVAALTALLDDPNVSAAVQAATLLGRMGPDAAPAVPALVPALRAKDHRLRLGAAVALGRLGMSDKSAAALLIQALCRQGNDSRLEEKYLDALGRMGGAAQAAVPLLLQLLDDDRSYPQSVPVFQALARIGPAARPAAPALKRLLQGQNPTMCVLAAAALWHVDPGAEAAALPVLLEGTKRPASFTGSLLYETLGKIGAPAKPAVPRLAAALRSGSPHARVPAALALWRIEADAAAASAALAEALENRHPFAVNREACVALAEIGPAARAALPQLMDTLKCPEPSVRRAAAQAVKSIDPAAAANAGVP